jgi:hypothetical protein
MKRIYRFLTPCFLAVLLIGCAASLQMPGAPRMARVGQLGAEELRIQSNRMIVWTALLTLEVSSVSDAVQQAISFAKNADGYVEHRSDTGEVSASLTLRVPTSSLKQVLDALESLGTVTHRQLSSEDVTEQYIDVEARLQNKIALRDRLKELLQKATDVKDVLAIETELSRVQADIDSMQGRLKALKGQVDMATIHVTIKREQILGPLGYLFKGIWWTIEKLFVIQK